jgi:hypothetical protein
MSISSLSSSSLSVYLQMLTGASSKSDSSASSLLNAVYGDSSGSTSTSTSTSSVRTTYLDEAAQGTVLTSTEQKAAQA